MKSIQNSITRAIFLVVAVLILPLAAITGCGGKSGVSTGTSGPIEVKKEAVSILVLQDAEHRREGDNLAEKIKMALAAKGYEASVIPYSACCTQVFFGNHESDFSLSGVFVPDGVQVRVLDTFTKTLAEYGKPVKPI